MFVESLINHLVVKGHSVVAPYDLNFLTSVNFSHQGLTEKQAKLAIKLLKKYSGFLTVSLKQDISNFLANPTFKKGIRIIDSSKSVDFFLEKEGIGFFLIKFPYDIKILNEIKEKRSTFFLTDWNQEDKIWKISVDHRSVQFVNYLINEHHFSANEKVLNLCRQIDEINLNLEKFVPMVTKNQDIYNFKNISEFLPAQSSDNFPKVLFDARKYGIFTWCENIETELEKNFKKNFIFDFLKSPTGTTFKVDPQKISIFDLQSLISYLAPCVFFIPAGQELVKVKEIFELAKNLKISNEQVTTLFRLPNDSNSEFNKFVREHELNSPISEETKFILLSHKVPKTLLQSKLKINSVILFSNFHPHYMVKEFISQFVNVIEFKTNNVL